MHLHRKWVLIVAVLCFVVSLTWSKVGRSQTKERGEDIARIMNAVDIVEIDNLESAFIQDEDSGRLDDVADMNIENGGRGIYYEDPTTGHLVVTGHPVDLQGNPLKDYPGCIMFGRANVKSYLVGSHLANDNALRPHADGWPGPGSVTRHIDVNRLIHVTGDTATLIGYYRGKMLTESDLVRTPQGWKFAFKKIIYEKPTPERACVIADPKFPIPPAGSFGVKPDFLHPN